MIEWLEEWYLSNCDGDWEHCYGIKIGTLDNPGWTVSVDLHETKFEGKDFNTIDIERSHNDWVYCKVEKNAFKGAGGPKNLKEMLTIFRDWVTKNEELNT